MNMFAGQNCRLALGVVHADRGSERNKVDVSMGQKIGVVGELLGDVEFFGGGMGSAWGGVTNGGEGETISEVRLTEVGQNSSLGDTAGTDDTHANDTHGCSSSLS